MKTKKHIGSPFYGQYVGILVLNSTGMRLVGDLGHALTFDYQVQYEILPFQFVNLLEKNDQILEMINHSCDALIAKGVKTILGDCGLLSLYQNEIASKFDIPIGLSSLIQIPMIWEMIGHKGTIGVITGHSAYLKKEHLLASGWREEIKVDIKGLETFSHFEASVIRGIEEQSPNKMLPLLIEAISDLINTSPDVKAIVLECSNLSTYSYELADYFDLPVFDALTLSNYLSSAIAPKKIL